MSSLVLDDYVLALFNLAIIFSLLISFGFVCYYKPYHPLRAHSLKILFVRLVGLIFYLLFAVLWNFRVFPCALVEVFGFPVMAMLVMSVLLNACRTFFRIRLSQDIGNLKVDSWFIKYRGVFTDQFWFMGMILHGAAGMCVSLIAEAVEDQYLSLTTDPVENCILFWALVSYLLLFLYLICFSIGLFIFYRKKLKGSTDGLFFIEEMKILIALWIPSIFIYYFLLIAVDLRIPRGVVIALTLGLSWHAPLTLAIIRSYRTKKFQFKVRLFEDIAMAVRDFTVSNSPRKASTDSNTSGSSTTALMLDEVLRDPEMKDKFKTFLVGEWSVETLLFYDEVRNFQRCTENEYATTAMKIFNNFFPSDSIYALHLPGSIVKQVKAKLENLSLNPDEWFKNIDLFEDAQEQIIENWLVDAFPRFSKRILKNPYVGSKSASLDLIDTDTRDEFNSQEVSIE